MQFQLACTKRQWCDWVSYDPRFPARMQLVIKRVARDQSMIDWIEDDVCNFLGELDTKIDTLRTQYDLAEVLKEIAA